MKTLNASCLCGGVKFQLLESPRRYYQCHCSLCRKQSGTSSNAATIVRSSQLEWNEGLTLIERFQKPTGFTSHFCRQCGSPLPNPLGNGAYTWVPLGLLDDPARAELALHLFTRSAAEWEAAPGVGLGFEEMPSLPEVLSLLHGSSEPA